MENITLKLFREIEEKNNIIIQQRVVLLTFLILIIFCERYIYYNNCICV